MRIDAVKVAFPSRVMDNAEILHLVRQHSQETFEGDLEHTIARIGKALHFSGAQRRRWLGEGETPIACILSATTEALDAAGVTKQDVDLLIYVGIGKGFVEPGQSYMVAHALGMDRVACFDIIDACMSWTRAMQIAESFLQTKRHRRILIVNGEINTYEGGPLFPCNYRLRNADELEWTFPSYTIGSAATATLVSADNDNPWTWSLSSRPDLADLCTVPTAGYSLFSSDAPKIGKNGVNRFTSFGKELHAHARLPVVAAMREILARHDDIGRIFTHTSSLKEWDLFGGEVGIQEKIYPLYPEYGNIVSASVPAGIALAVDEGLVRRGDRLAGWVGSAGMSFSAYSFKY
jgi:3-oxoacyl-[acyl-carrier-protein] synthase III